MKPLAYGILAIAAIGAAGPVAAQVRYAPPPWELPYVASPYDESYGTSPSFQILPGDYGYPPAVRVVEHCQYPHGWNVTDFTRDVNGTPAGVDHACLPYRGRLRSRY